MTKEEIEISKALGEVKAQSGSFDKKFIANISSTASNNTGYELSSSQKEWIYRLVYKYRKQIPETYDYCKSDPRCSMKE